MATKRKQRRRGHGEGTIFRRKDGVWVATISIGKGLDGKRQRRTVYGDDEKAVQEKLLELRMKLQNGTLATETGLTVAAMVERWLKFNEPPRIAPSTHLRYESICKNHILPRLGSQRLLKLSPLSIESMYAAMAGDGCSDSTREHTHRVLRRILNQSVKWKCIPASPMAAVDSPKVERPEISPLTMIEAQQLLKAAGSHRLHAVFVLAVTTGMRQGEIFGLQWADLNLELKRLTVKHTLEEIRGKLRLKSPKSRAGRRSIDLLDITVDALQNHKARMMTEGLLAQSYIFTDTLGNPMRKSNFDRRVWKPLRKAAEIPEIRFHDLRHTHATVGLESGVEMKSMQERLGHSTIALTLDTYSHVTVGMRSDTVEKLNRAFG